MLNTHFADIKEIFHLIFAGKFPHALDLLRRLDILVGGEVIHDQRHTAFVEYAAGAAAFEFVDCDRGGDVIAQT